MDGVKDQRDEELLTAHLSGQPGAFDILVARYTDGLYGFLLKFVGNTAVADDLVQESFLQVHMAANTFDPRRSFRPWLYTVAANKARDYLRGRGRRQEKSLDAGGSENEGLGMGQRIAADDLAVAEQAQNEESRQLVRALITKLPEHLRLILMLGYYQQLPYAEIATVLDIPVGTVKSRLHSAVTQFAKLWRAHARTAESPDT
ncbi:MAG: RNA polymerase sigma factor [Planctomycetota bacterium]